MLHHQLLGSLDSSGERWSPPPRMAAGCVDRLCVNIYSRDSLDYTMPWGSGDTGTPHPDTPPAIGPDRMQRGISPLR
jgi:hypothetical protein